MDLSSHLISSHSILFSRHFNPSISYSIHSHLISHSISILFYSILFSDQCWSIKGLVQYGWWSVMQFLHIWTFCMMVAPLSTRMRVRYKRRACFSSVLSHPLLFSYHSCCLSHPSYSIIHLIQSSSSLLFMMNG